MYDYFVMRKTMVFVGIDDLFDITSELEDVFVNWRGIGLALRLHNPDLRKIATEGKDVMDCLTDMLELWLNHNYDVIKPVWGAIMADVGECCQNQSRRKYSCCG